MTPAFQGLGLIFLLATFSLATADAARAPVLRYRPTAEQTNVYHVQIEIRGESGTENLSGNLFLVPEPGESNLIFVTLRGTLLPARQTRMMYPGNGYVAPQWPGPVALGEGCEWQMDERGNLLALSGDFHLPVPLGSVVQLFLQPFPSSIDSHWETADEPVVLDQPQALGPGVAFLNFPNSGIPVPRMNPYNRRGIAVLPGLRINRYQRRESDSTTVTLQKSVTFKTTLRTGSDPRISGSSENKVVFDRESGFLRNAKTDFKAVINTETVTRRMTGTVEIQLLEGDERDAAFEKAATPNGSSRKLTPEELEKIMTDLKSEEENVKRQAVMRLQSVELPEPSAELMEALSQLAFDSDSYSRNVASVTLAKYGTKEQVPVLLKLLEAGFNNDRYAIIRALGRIGDQRAVEPLANAIARGQDSYLAAEALSKLGPSAEAATLPLLKLRNVETLRYACNVLKETGTAKSLEPLRELLLDPDPSVNSAAAEAIRMIQLREK
ncbi:MAG TPA: HEAT repeat domain-containing protein [Verrucomicrobiae bacterium]